MLLSELLTQNARLYPDDIALVELRPSQNLRKTMSWREFDERANRVANALIASGIKKGSSVFGWQFGRLVEQPFNLLL